MAIMKFIVTLGSTVQKVSDRVTMKLIESGKLPAEQGS